MMALALANVAAKKHRDRRHRLLLIPGFGLTVRWGMREGPEDRRFPHAPEEPGAHDDCRRGKKLQAGTSGVGCTNWRAELAIRFGVILRKVWGGSRTWAGARAQSVLMSVWRTCWQQGHSALDHLSQILRGISVELALPP
jgi:hypothetical protein